MPYAAFRPEFTDVMDALGRGTFDELLVDAYLPLVPGLAARLAAGARVADVGCGTGHAMVLLAAAFPASTFVGYDLAEDAVARARSEAAAAGLANARFEVRDAAGLTVERALRRRVRVRRHPRPGGPGRRPRADPRRPGPRRHLRHGGAPGRRATWRTTSANPLAPMLYSVSTLHCLTVSLADGGAGLGTAWGEQLARSDARRRRLRRRRSCTTPPATRSTPCS